MVASAALAYACLYAAAPGRQRPPVPPRRAALLRSIGAAVGVGSLVVAGLRIGWGVGTVLWAAAALTSATILVVAGPLVDPATAASASDDAASGEGSAP